MDIKKIKISADNNEGDFLGIAFKREDINLASQMIEEHITFIHQTYFPEEKREDVLFYFTISSYITVLTRLLLNYPASAMDNASLCGAHITRIVREAISHETQRSPEVRPN